MPPTPERKPSVAQLYPNLAEGELGRLDAWCAGYAALILRLYERISSDPEAYARFLALTDRPAGPSMTAKVDSPSQTNENKP